MVRYCRRCGASAEAPEEGLPEGWSLDTTDGEVHFLCGTCTRANLRSIEGRLSTEWWDA